MTGLPRHHGRWLRGLATVVLGLWLDDDERAEVLDDISALSEGVEARHGPVAATLWRVGQLLRYPGHMIGLGRRVARPPLRIPLSGGRGAEP